MTVYLLHFEEPTAHAQHYLGYVEGEEKEALESRMELHKAGNGSKYIRRAFKSNGKDVSFVLARTWKGGYSKEKQLKRQKNSPRLCPICNQKHKK